MAIRDISAWALGETSGIYTAPTSGTTGNPTAAENVSGVRAICFNQSGLVVVAMASVSGRWPAIGISTQNTLSGFVVPWSIQGTFQNEFSGAVQFSGFFQKRVWLGRSGQIAPLSGSWSSGGFASGDIGQPLGVVINSGGFVFNVVPFFWSGGPIGLAPGGAF